MPINSVQEIVQLRRILQKLAGRLRPYNVYFTALLIFAGSRVVVALGVVFGTLLVRVPDPTKSDAGTGWYDRLLRWDSGWYAAIISEGYHFSEDPSQKSSTVFYPLYPLVSNAVRSVFGVSQWFALLIVANLASLLVALLLTNSSRTSSATR